MLEKRKIYLVDTENVGKKWMLIIPELKKHDKLILFYTDIPVNYNFSEIEKIYSCKNISFSHCFNGHANALDFQLSATIGRIAKKNKRYQYIIVSDDARYDSVIKYLRTTGINIGRMLLKVSAKEIKEKELEYIDKNISKKLSNTPKVEPLDDFTENVSAILKLPKAQSKNIAKTIKNIQQHSAITSDCKLSEIHNKLQKQYGETGKKYYRTLKSSGILTQMSQK